MVVDSVERALPANKAYCHLYSMVQSGRIKRGGKIPSGRDLVKAISVSRPTVGKAIDRLIAEGILCRQDGRKGTFLSKTFGSLEGHETKSFAAKRSGSEFIKLAVSSDYKQVPIKSGVMEGMHSVCSKLGIHTAIEYIDFNNGWCEKAVGNGSGDCLGLVLWATPEYFKHEDITFFSERQIPVVCVDTHPDEGNDSNFVVSDNVSGAKLAVNYLISLGHERICYLASTVDSHLSSQVDRKTGFVMGMLENSVRFSNDNIIEVKVDFSNISLGLDRIFEGAYAPTAIFLSNDRYAMMVIEYLRNRGLKCPDDVSIIGYDDIDMAQYMSVPLTTIRQDFFEMGEVAARVLFSAISSTKVSPAEVPYHVFLKPTLVKRESVKNIKL